jgi:DnaK suppressor protein
MTRTFPPTTARRLERRLEQELAAATVRAAALRQAAAHALDDIDVSDLLDHDGHDGLAAGVEHDALLRLAEAADRRVAEAEVARYRLEDSSYGICGSCLRPIPLARLEALPTTTSCVTCAVTATGFLAGSAA